MSQFPTLKTTPIQEIIFSISYAENISQETLKDFGSKSEISKKFTFLTDGYTAKLTAKKDENPPKAAVSKDGLVFRCSEENKIIQAREGSFSFHKVNGYESFDTLLPEFLSYWRTFLNCVNINLTVNNISLRYLNFIELLDGETFLEISNIKPANPFVDDLVKYLIRMEFFDDEHPDLKIGVVQAPTLRLSKTGLMLDTNITQRVTTSIILETIEEYLKKMRILKNDVFFKAITDKVIKRYQQ